MPRYTWKRGAWRDRDGNLMPIPEREGPTMPIVWSDIKEYASPIDGKMITSRSARRYDLESNNCVPSDPPTKKRGYRNPNFALKRGLKLNEEAREALAKKQEI